MNLTRDFYTYISVVRKSFYETVNIQVKEEIVDLCSKMLEKISESERNIESLNKITNKSSLFNDSHLKLNNLVENIKDRLNSLQDEIQVIENHKVKNFKGNIQHVQSYSNIIDLVKSKLFRISEKFKKSLQMQSETIKYIEERRSNFTQLPKTNKNTKKNPFVYTNLPNDENETNETDQKVLNFKQKTEQNVYYQERTSAVEKIEITMHELTGMFSKMANYVNEAQYMIERIEQNTNNSLNNIEKGYKEASIYEQGIKSNKALCLKVFFILVFFSVLYIVFLS